MSCVIGYLQHCEAVTLRASENGSIELLCEANDCKLEIVACVDVIA